ncbi:MAG: YgiQ family radical SAM protein, partial [Cetobacterium sp.]
MMFLPTTKDELIKLGWEQLDIILVSGDTYIDSSYNGSAIIGKWLTKHGFKVGIIAQPDVNSPNDITRLGEPRLFWGVSAGCVDSMVANYTATKKRRKNDDFTPGAENNRRPDRASMVYTNLIKRFFKNSGKPIVLGGI